MNEKKVWFITGSSTGFGRELAEEVLAQGHKVVATARKPEAVQDLVEKFPNAARAIKLDVTKPDEVRAAIAEAAQEFGRIDVLVNNAGYGLIGAVEEVSDAQFRHQFETNVFGAVDVMRAALPVLREQKSGHILNISSVGGFVAFPSSGFYTASKFALEAFSEALAAEVAPLGIKVTIVEPGAFRTDFNGRSLAIGENRMDDVYPTTNGFLGWLQENDGKQPGDPRKAARAMIKVVESENPPLRLPLGEDAIQMIEAELEKVKNDIAPWRQTGVDTTFPGMKANIIGG
jgi:NAD(P)-dependent dehydrogenase (short-subunit alcohol dehydrogenase family)